MKTEKPRARSTRHAPARTGTSRTGTSSEHNEKHSTQRAAIAPKKDNTIYIVAGAGGGLLILLILIAVAASGNTPTEIPDKPETSNTYVPPPTYKVSRAERGHIMFICSNSPGHDDKEVILKHCSKCGSYTSFYWEEQHKAYRCYSCKNLIGQSDIKCPDCGRHPRKAHLKPF